MMEKCLLVNIYHVLMTKETSPVIHECIQLRFTVKNKFLLFRVVNKEKHAFFDRYHTRFINISVILQGVLLNGIVMPL